MISKNRICSKCNFIYIWSLLFMITIYAFTLFTDYRGIIIYIIYSFMALPFYKHIDKFAVLCFLVATLSDFFAGADANVWSIYTIFLIVAFINIISRRKVSRINIVPFLILIVAIHLSYVHSQFFYLKGELALIYNIIVAVTVVMVVRFEDDTLKDYIPMFAAVITIMYVISIFSSGLFTGPAISVSTSINHNSFGRSIAQVAIILISKRLQSNGKSAFYTILCVVSVSLTLLSGSRNAFLALLVAAIFVYGYIQRNEGKAITGIIKICIFGTCSLLIINLFLPYSEFDFSRFNYIALVKNGGTNRVYLWTLLIPVIMKNYPWFGYGPSYYCSAQIIYPLVHRAYTNTHNTFLEAWGELGFVGLAPFSLIMISSLIKIFRKTENNINYLVILGLFIDVLVNGIGEAMFAGINLWILIGFCYSGILKKKKCEFQTSN